MKISSEKSHFFPNSVEYLGHIIQYNKITVDPKKIETIRDYPLPKTLRQLRGFLGLSNYYRKFIRNYAQIAKPMNIHLCGDNDQIKKGQSDKVPVELDRPQ